MNDTKTVIGVDIAKRVFQVHAVDVQTGELGSVQLKRAKFLEYFVNRAPCLIGREACGGAQHWARRLTAMGHTVKLLPARQVRPFVGGSKSDQADARAIGTAVQQPGLKAVRNFTSCCRIRCKACKSCWATLLTFTNRMLGRLIASQIASASLASFLLLFTYGFTNCGAINFTRNP